MRSHRQMQNQDDESLFGLGNGMDLGLDSFVDSCGSNNQMIKSFAFGNSGASGASGSNSNVSAITNPMFLTPVDSTNSKEKMRASVIFDECPLSDADPRQTVPMHATPQLPGKRKEKSPNLLRELDEKLSSIKLDKTKCLSQDMEMEEEDEEETEADDDLLLMSVDPMNDDEFFGNCGENNKILSNSSKINVNYG